MRFLLYPLIAVLALGSFASCSDDDEPVAEPETGRPAGGDSEEEPVGEEWIDPDFASLLRMNGIIEDPATVKPSDIVDITEIDIQYPGEIKQLTSLRGIERFHSLVRLICSDHKLTELDLSGCPELEYLDCGYNQISSIDLSKCPKLTYADCSVNGVSEIVLDNPALEELNLAYSALASFDGAGIPAMKRLYLYTSSIESLDITKCASLEWLFCYQCRLPVLDISKNRSLTKLYAMYNPGKDYPEGRYFVITAWFNYDSFPEEGEYTDSVWRLDDGTEVETWYVLPGETPDFSYGF